jgi:sodium/bile acid cotransporter 7
MLLFLARRWFLLFLAAGLALAVSRPEWLLPVTDALPLRLIVATSLFLMACNLESRQLARALARPGCVLWSAAISFVALPALALVVGSALPVDDLRVGLLIIASVPCTLSSAVLWTRHAGGDEALALLVVILTNSLGWLVTPLWLAAAGSGEVTLDAAAMMRALVVVGVVPVVLGQGVRLIPGVAALLDRHRTFNGILARLLVATVLICAAAAGAAQADRLSGGLVVVTAGVCIGLHLAGVGLGMGGARLARLGQSEQIAVAFAGSQKTLPIGLFLFETYFRSDYPLAVVTLLFYHAGQLLVDTIIADAVIAGRGSGRKP